MKRIINGRMYNTETARPVIAYTACAQGLEYGMTLYRKKTGEFFTCDEVGNIETLPYDTIEFAKGIIEAHGTVEQYIAEFGEPEE